MNDGVPFRSVLLRQQHGVAESMRTKTRSSFFDSARMGHHPFFPGAVSTTMKGDCQCPKTRQHCRKTNHDDERREEKCIISHQSKKKKPGEKRREREKKKDSPYLFFEKSSPTDCHMPLSCLAYLCLVCLGLVWAWARLGLGSSGLGLVWAWGSSGLGA